MTSECSTLTTAFTLNPPEYAKKQNWACRPRESVYTFFVRIFQKSRLAHTQIDLQVKGSLLSSELADMDEEAKALEQGAMRLLCNRAARLGSIDRLYTHLTDYLFRVGESQAKRLQFDFIQMNRRFTPPQEG